MGDFNLTGRRVWVAGHRGMVGSAIARRLEREGCEVLTVGRDRVDLRRQSEVEDWMAEARPDAVFLAAGTVGGILANDSRPAEFIYDNLMIEANVTHASWRIGVEKLLFLGSSCIYPKLAPQPMAEDALLSSQLEPTNQWYAIAKISGIKLTQAYRAQYGCNFISVMTTNLYGQGDNFNMHGSHVLPALLRKAHEAKLAGAPALEVWGTGTPRREFLHVDDLADAVVHVMRVYDGTEHVNIGSGTDLTIRELAELVCETVGFRGELRFDSSKPDGTPRKLLDVGRLNGLGWHASIGLPEGIAQTYRWFLDNIGTIRE